MTDGHYRPSMAVRVKDVIRKTLKTLGGCGLAYLFCQKCWRAYAVPRRRKRLQVHGPAALKRLDGLMKEHCIPYYADFGTLIGFVRDKGFIKHDDDVDISIVSNAAKPADVLKVFLDAGYGFVHAFDYQGAFLEFTVADVSGITIDVFFAEKTDVQGVVHKHQPIWNPSVKYPDEKANTLIQYDFLEPTELIDYNVCGAMTRIPKNYAEVLESEYGQWAVPDAHFDTVKDRIHRTLPGFAYRLSQEEALKHE